ncbi:hypothetical protein AVEN_95480-1 [Araneus ventricosus]|uniref:Uncharacterized protein n=1 Tax=Araneus ventricosus TaxID=182803 RepID=A0A4Y2RA35_ARAVE|nr:hypothetical protein AVEN_95480-1 [Araneus ventricosus]
MCKDAFQRPVFPRVSSTVRVISCRRNRKNRCGSWACASVASRVMAASKESRAARRHQCLRERYRDICKATRRAVGTARLFQFNRPHSTSTNLVRLEVWPSHTPLEQGLRH